MEKQTEGYILIGIGEPYLKLATNLIHTLRKCGDTRDVHVITEPDLDDLYNQANTNFERYGTVPKITLDRFLPFDHNIFLDADILCCADTEHVWDFFKSNTQFIQQLGTLNNSHMPMDNISKYEPELGFQIPKVHGGVIYINKNTLNKDFFLWMREYVFPNFGKIIHSTPLVYKNSRPDQEIYSIAYGKFGLKVWEIWDHPIMTVLWDTEVLPKTRVTFRTFKGPELNKEVPFAHIFKGKATEKFKCDMPHYNEMYNNIMNS
jgi:hypothetical protein